MAWTGPPKTYDRSLPLHSRHDVPYNHRRLLLKKFGNFAGGEFEPEGIGHGVESGKIVSLAKQNSLFLLFRHFLCRMYR